MEREMSEKEINMLSFNADLAVRPLCECINYLYREIQNLKSKVGDN